jgi:hypothetical protein
VRMHQCCGLSSFWRQVAQHIVGGQWPPDPLERPKPAVAVKQCIDERKARSLGRAEPSWLGGACCRVRGLRLQPRQHLLVWRTRITSA